MMFCLLIRQLSVFLTVFKWYHRCIRVSLVAVFSTVLMHNLDVLLALTLRFDDLLLNWICLLHFVYLWNRIHVCHVVMKCFMQAEAYCSPPVSQSIQTCRRRCIVLHLSVHQSRLAGRGVLFSTCQSTRPDLQAEAYCSPPVSQSVSQLVRLFVRSSIIKLVNTMFHKRMNLFWCKLAQMVHIEGHEKINFGVRRSKVKVKIQKFILSR